MSTSTEAFDIPLDIARRYEATFVPAIFAEWAPHTLDAAGVGPADHLLDVACGTGIVARTALDRVEAPDQVTGVDLNPSMLAVAAEIEPRVAWRVGDVAALPFPDDTFDAVTCQMAAMFFADRVAAFREMGRVARPAGRIAVAVPAALDRQPAYRPFVDAAARHAGPDAVALLSAYWSCGDLDALTAEATDAGLDVVDRRTRTGVCTFASPAEFVQIEISASPLAERVDAAQTEAIVADVTAALSPRADEAFSVPLVGHLLTVRPGG